MSRYSVAEAKNTLPRLIDKALSGEEVVITRHGKAVAELRPTVIKDPTLSPSSYGWLKAQRSNRKPLSVPINSVELLNRLHDEDEA